MPVHNKGVMSSKADVYCSLLPGLTFCAGKWSLNNSCPLHLCVHGEIFSSHCWFDLIQISTVATVSEQTRIMVGPACIVGSISEWIMIRWAVTRGTDGQRNISHSVYTSHYLSTLCTCGWTGTSPPSKHGGSQRSEAAAMHRAWSESPCSLWSDLTIRSGPHSHMNIGCKCSHEIRKLLTFSSKMDLLSYLLLPSHLLLRKMMSYFPFIAEITTNPLRKWLFVFWTQ